MPRCYMMKKKSPKSTCKTSPNKSRTKATSKCEDSNTRAVYTPLTNRPRRATRDTTPSSSSSLHTKTPSRDSDYSSINCVYRTRSAEETEAAHDLLSLSQSLPPLQAPGVVTVADDNHDHHSSSPILTYRPLSADKIKPDSPQVLYLVPLPHRDNPTPPSSDCSMDALDHVDPLIVQTATIRMQGQCGPVAAGEDIIILPLSPEPERRSCEIETQTEEVMTIRVVQNDRKGKEDKTGKGGKRKAKRKQDENSNSSNIDSNSPKKLKTKFFTVVEDDRISSIAEETDSKTRFICGVCGKQYATSSNLSRHKQTHRSLDSHSAKKCMTCGKAYVSMPALAMHVLTHKLNHSCSICGKQFSRPWLLQGHLRSHTGERPYGCAHCGKKFADRSNLRAHMQTHSEAKNYKCSICQKTFALKSYLNKHLESSCQIGSPDNLEADDPECVAGK